MLLVRQTSSLHRAERADGREPLICVLLFERARVDAESKDAISFTQAAAMLSCLGLLKYEELFPLTSRACD